MPPVLFMVLREPGAHERLLWKHTGYAKSGTKIIKRRESLEGVWLGDQDSNLDRQIQSLLSCRWTIPQLAFIYTQAAVFCQQGKP